MAKRINNLEAHVNEWCIAHGLPYGYKDLVRWVEQGDEFGEKVPVSKLVRVFKTKRRETIEKWLRRLEKDKAQPKPVDK